MQILYLIAVFLPLGLLLFFWISYRRSRDQFMGGGFLSGFSKSPAKRYEPSDQTMTFQDVAGLGGRQGGPAGDRRVPEEPGEVPAAGRPRAQGRAAERCRRAPARRCWPGRWPAKRGCRSTRSAPASSSRCSSGVGASRVRDLFKNAKDNCAGDHLHRRDRRRRPAARRGTGRRPRRARADAEPDPQRDGRLHADRFGDRAGRHEPARRARSRPCCGPAASTGTSPSTGRRYKGRVEIFKVHVRDVPAGRRRGSGTAGRRPPSA